MPSLAAVKRPCGDHEQHRRPPFLGNQERIDVFSRAAIAAWLWGNFS